MAKIKVKKKRTLTAGKSAASPTRYGIVVLGMHRSDTSALTAVLGSLGCDLPKTLMVANETNPKGFFESDLICHLNDDLLASAGTTWHDWQPVYPGWFNSPKAGEFHNLALEALGKEFGKSHLFVLKDPRICRLAPFWFDSIESAGCTPLAIHTHRHPLEVAASLDGVAGYKQTFSTLLWLRHILDAEIGSRGRPRVFTCHNALMEDWVGVTDKIAAGLGLEWPRAPEKTAAEINSFLEPALRHFSSSPSLTEERNMPVWVRETNDILIRWATTEEDPKDHATLDRIRADLETASPNFAAIVRENPENLNKIAHLENLRDELQAKLAQEDETRRDTEERITQLSAGHLLQEVEDIRKDRDGFHDLLVQETQALEESEAALADAKHENGQLRSALLQRQQETEDLSQSSTEDKKRIIELTVALESVREERFRLERHLTRNEQNLTLLTGRVAEIMRMEITNSLAEDVVGDLKAENRSLQEDVKLFQAEAARAQSLQQEAEALRIEAARAQSLQQEAEALRIEAVRAQSLQQEVEALRTQTGERKAALEEQSIQQSQERANYKHRITELEILHDQVLQSTSWKITGPLRRVVMIFRNSRR